MTTTNDILSLVRALLIEGDAKALPLLADLFEEADDEDAAHSLRAWLGDEEFPHLTVGHLRRQLLGMRADAKIVVGQGDGDEGWASFHECDGDVAHSVETDTNDLNNVVISTRTPLLGVPVANPDVLRLARREVADREWNDYDFGYDTVEDVRDWQAGDDEFSREYSVLLGDGPLPQLFVVRFFPGTAEVEESYA